MGGNGRENPDNFTFKQSDEQILTLSNCLSFQSKALKPKSLKSNIFIHPFAKNLRIFFRSQRQQHSITLHEHTVSYRIMIRNIVTLK